MHKQYRLRTIKNPDGEIRWYIEMDPEFIEPIKGKKIFAPFRSITLGEIVTHGAEHNFNIIGLGSVLHQIEMCVREVGLRKVK